MFYTELIARFLVWRYILHWLAGSVFGLLAILAFATAGYWWLLIICVVFILVLGSVIKCVQQRVFGGKPREKTLEELDAEAQQVRAYAAGYSFAPTPSAPSRSGGRR